MVTTPHGTAAGPSLFVIEGASVLLLAIVAAGYPQVASGLFLRAEKLFDRLARRKVWSVCVVGLSAALLRLLLIPFVPIPRPFIEDDFSYLLAGETFASGRLTNPTHPMWVHFESFHITHVPTYMSMYFPAQGLALAAGKLLFGHPWYGVWASSALMCALICWMLQGWVPPRWALLGGMLAVVRLALFSYWGNTYTGGAVAAIGGALVLGALPRLRLYFRARDWFWMALGMAILANSRPYEGLLVCVPAICAVCWWVYKRPHPSASVLLQRIAPGAVLLLLTAAFMAYYNYRVFGNAFTPPYAVNRATYGIAPHFLWQSPRPEPVYRHAVMRDLYTRWELDWFKKSRTFSGLLQINALKLAWAETFFIGFALVLPLVTLPRALRDRRIRFLSVCALVFVAGLAIETWMIPHYVAPFTAGIFALLVQCMRHLRAWRPGGTPAGLFLVRAIPALCLGLAVLRVFAQPLHLYLAPDKFSTRAWFGTRPLGLDRAHVEQELESYPGQQLAVVRYGARHDAVYDWVYNAADIDKSRVVWARDMDPASNLELFRYFNNRKVWLVEPDLDPPRVIRYPVTSEIPGSETQIAWKSLASITALAVVKR
jgi:hypothetical protein